MSSTNFRCRAERLPLRKLFKRDCAFPRAVRGPVDFLALLRLACKRAGVSVGDLRNDMAAPHDKPATSIHPSLISSRDILSQKAPAGGAETDLLFNLWLDQSITMRTFGDFIIKNLCFCFVRIDKMTTIYTSIMVRKSSMRLN